MRDSGYASLTMEELVNARDHGVTPEYVRELGEAGHRKLPLRAADSRPRPRRRRGIRARHAAARFRGADRRARSCARSRRDRGVRARHGGARLHEPDARQPDSHSRPRRDAGLRESAEGARLRPPGSRGSRDAAGSRADVRSGSGPRTNAPAPGCRSICSSLSRADCERRQECAGTSWWTSSQRICGTASARSLGILASRPSPC